MSSNAYFEQFQITFPKKIKPLADHRDDLRKQIGAAMKRISDETALAQRVQQQISKLKSLAGESLAGGQGEFEKFRLSMRKRMDELAASKEIIETLEGEVLPRLREECTLTERKISDAVTALALELRPKCEARMAELLGEIVAEHDGFLDAFDQLCIDHGTSFSRLKSSHVPIPSHPRWDPKKFGSVVALSLQERMERMRKQSA